MAIGGIAFLLFGTFMACLLLGCPIMASLGAASIACFLAQGIDLSIMLERAFASLTVFPLMALPAFVLTGALMEACGISRRLVNIAEAITKNVTGGLAIATILASVFFGAISGSGPATTAAVGMLMIPAMIRHGYRPVNAAAITSTAGGIGIIIPPSIAMIVYGVCGQASISALFMAGIIPGLMLALALCLFQFVTAPKISLSAGRDRGLTFGKSLIDGLWAILAPVLILGGIYTGLFTPTEAAAAAIFYTLFIGIFIYRELNVSKILSALNVTTWLAGRLLLLVFTASVFSFLLTINNIPQKIAEAMLEISGNLAFIWAMVIGLLLFLGMFMETLALIMLVTPVLLPVMTTYGVSPIHFGLVMISCCAIGFTTPPLGENLFIVSGISGDSAEAVAGKAIPMLAICLVIIALLAAFPALSLWLPELMLKTN